MAADLAGACLLSPVASVSSRSQATRIKRRGSARPATIEDPWRGPDAAMQSVSGRHEPATRQTTRRPGPRQ